MIDISVIVPIYNGEVFIDRCMKSLSIQEECEFEIIAINDGSTDNTKNVLLTWQKHFGKRLKFVEQDNRGASAARNRGIGIASGKYITFLDVDDEYLPGRLKKYVDFFEANPDVGVVYSEPISSSKGRDFQFYQHKKRKTPQGWVYKELLTCFALTLPTVAFRSELLRKVGGFDESFKVLEDYDLWLRLALLTPFAYINEVLTRINVVPNSLSRGSYRLEVPYYRRTLLEKHKEFIHDKFKFPSLVYRRLYADTYFDEGVNVSKLGDHKVERSLYIKSFAMYPLNLKPLKRLLRSFIVK